MMFIDGIIDRIGSMLDPPPPTNVVPLDDKTPAFGEQNPGGNATVSGVVLPKLVVDQLQRLGISLSWYSQYELEAAVRGCAIDCTLIDDPDGNNFLDDLSLDANEIDKDEDEFDPTKLHRLKPVGGNIHEDPDDRGKTIFGDRIKEERQRKKRAEQAAETGGNTHSSQMCA